VSASWRRERALGDIVVVFAAKGAARNGFVRRRGFASAARPGVGKTCVDAIAAYVQVGASRIHPAAALVMNMSSNVWGASAAASLSRAFDRVDHALASRFAGLEPRRSAPEPSGALRSAPEPLRAPGRSGPPALNPCAPGDPRFRDQVSIWHGRCAL